MLQSLPREEVRKKGGERGREKKGKIEEEEKGEKGREAAHPQTFSKVGA